jgi:hypothetical protein
VAHHPYAVDICYTYYRCALSVFPFLDAKQALGQTLPNTDLVIVETRTLCKLPRGTYIFGYDFGVKTDKGHKKTLGRNGETLLTVDGFWLSEPKYKYLESRIAAQSRMPGLLWTRSTLRSERTLTNTAATNLEL